MTMRQIPVVCCVACAACSTEPPKVAEPPLTPAAASPEPRETPRSATANESVEVYVDRKVLDLCYVPLPHFSFDSAALSDRGRDALEDLAECFVDGAAAGERLSIVGHTDPRGGYAYNLALGERRAARVAQYLEDQGVARQRMETSSRGEMDAKGTDETSFAADRRVGIFLAE